MSLPITRGCSDTLVSSRFPHEAAVDAEFLEPAPPAMTPTAPRAARPSRPGRSPVRPAQALAQIRLQRPDPGPQLLERPRLFEALSEHAERPLSVVVAEAGYGKTSLCAAWVRRLRRPVVWYSLTPSDADLIVFGSTLLAGLRREFPRVGRSFERALDEAKPGARTAEMLAGTLVHELATLRTSRALIVLDDFQDVAASAPVSTFVEILLRDLPDSVRVLIASRTPPPVALERLRARGQVFELHSGHLRFTREELQRLFDEVYQRPISDEELTLLDETTLGWPTAVHLVHESLRRRESNLEQVLSDFRASRLELRDYLSSEVYARLEPESRRLLERTAVLPRFDAGLAGELTGMPRPDTTLDALVRRGLLRAFGSGEHVTYECHELVRAFVRHELEARLGADGVRDLHAEAAAARIGRGDSEAALGHLFAAGHTTQAAAVLCEIGPGLLRQGRAAVVRGWLAELPDELLRQDLELAVMQAHAAQALGDWDEAERRYSEVLERCRVGSSIPGRVSPRAIECRVLVGLGKVMNMRGRHEQVLGMAERGLAVACDLELEPRVRLMQMKAGAHFYLGQFKGAIDVLAQVRSLLEKSREHTELLVPTLHNLAIAHAAQGYYREALEEFRVALAQVRGTDSPRAPLYLSNLAFLHADLGELAEGRHAAEEGLAASQRFSNRAQECVCHQGLAQILAASGDLDGALAALRKAEELNGELRIQVIAADLLATRGRIFCARGEYRRAVEFMEQAIARVGERADAPRKLDFQSALAWCELRAGRPRVARDLLESLVTRADAGENDAQRTHVHYWYAETLLALHEPGKVDPHLGLALRLARERGYLHFLRVQAREEPAPLLHALEKGLEVDTVVAALVEAGPAIETELVEMLEHAPPPVAEAAAAVLGEVGGAPAMEALERVGKHRRSLASAFRTARRHISERVERGPPRRGAWRCSGRRAWR